MNGQGSRAFRRALTEAVLEEHEGAAGAEMVLKASKRGRGNGFARTVRYAFIAAALIAATIVPVLASTDTTGARYPAEEAKNAHYEYVDTGEIRQQKSVIEEVYCPQDLPFRFKMGDPWIAYDVVDIPWYADDANDYVILTQHPLYHLGYNDPETQNYPEEITWEKRVINGFNVTIFYKDGNTEFWWEDGEYFFILLFHWDSSTEEDRYNVFESIAVDERLTQRLKQG